MTNSELYSFKEAQWRYGQAFGLRMGLNTAYLYLDALKSASISAGGTGEVEEQFLRNIRDMLEREEADYEYYKELVRQHPLTQQLYEEESYAEQQAEGQAV